MKVGALTYGLLSILVPGLILLLVVGVAWIVWHTDLSGADDTTKEAILYRLKGSTEVYYSRLNFYSGVCADIGLPKGFSCNDSEGAFGLSTVLSDGSFLCTDSEGFLGKTRQTLGKSHKCTH